MPSAPTKLSVEVVSRWIEHLGAARPTAVNLRWALKRLSNTASLHQESTPSELADALVVGHRDPGPGSVGPGALDVGIGERGPIADRDIPLSLVADFEPERSMHAVFDAAEFDHVLPL